MNRPYSVISSLPSPFISLERVNTHHQSYLDVAKMAETTFHLDLRIYPGSYLILVHLRL